MPCLVYIPTSLSSSIIKSVNISMMNDEILMDCQQLVVSTDCQYCNSHKYSLSPFYGIQQRNIPSYRQLTMILPEPIYPALQEVDILILTTEDRSLKIYYCTCSYTKLLYCS